MVNAAILARVSNLSAERRSQEGGGSILWIHPVAVGNEKGVSLFVITSCGGESSHAYVVFCVLLFAGLYLFSLYPPS